MHWEEEILPPLEAVRFQAYDGELFVQGKHYESDQKLGAHPCRNGNTAGVYFALWAPEARKVSILTEVNGYREDVHRMWPAPGNAGVWELFIANVKPGDIYRYAVIGADGVGRLKSDPYAFQSELRPASASIVAARSGYSWGDQDYLEKHNRKTAVQRPMAIYEVHLGSWKRGHSRSNRGGFLNYRRLADQLAEYVGFMGFTHVELMGICEYPFDGSWGYQCTGYFAPTRRYGLPDDFRYLVDKLHRCGIGVILDWVPAHFSKDAFGLGQFDGTPLYEYADPLRREMSCWGAYAFDHGKPQVRSFLISSAVYWIREFHIDGLRVDAVAAMLKLDFDGQTRSRNRYGGMENLEGMAFLRQLNDAVHYNTRAFVIAEDSTALPGITEDTARQGMGFDFKWNMGWTFDTLHYFQRDADSRKQHHAQVTNPYGYAFQEDYVLPLSHDEVVSGKHTLLGKMPGGAENRRGSLKALYALQFTSPGKKLLFMGQEFGENREWRETREIHWQLADDGDHRDILLCVRRLLQLYRRYPCLHSDSRDTRTFQWINGGDGDRSILSYIRRNPWNYHGALLVIANLSPWEYPHYRCGVPFGGDYHCIFSTCDRAGDGPVLPAEYGECDGQPFHISYGLRPNEVIAIQLPG